MNQNEKMNGLRKLAQDRLNYLNDQLNTNDRLLSASEDESLSENFTKKELQKLRKDLNMVIASFDNEIVNTKLRVDRIEENLHLPAFV